VRWLDCAATASDNEEICTWSSLLSADELAGLPEPEARDDSWARLVSDAVVPAKPSLYIRMLIAYRLSAPVPDWHEPAAQRNTDKWWVHGC
jgi:hypothetical protein